MRNPIRHWFHPGKCGLFVGVWLCLSALSVSAQNIHQKNLVQHLEKRSQELEDQGNLSSAAVLLTRALLLPQESSHLRLRRAILYARLRWERVALRELSNVIEEERTSGAEAEPEAYLYRSRVYSRIGEHSLAEADAQEALRVLADWPQAQAQLGRSLAAQGRHAEAILPLSAALSKQPDHFEARLHRGVALYYENRLPEAVADLREALRIDPQNPLARNNLGLLLLQLDSESEALTQLLHAYQIASRNGQVSVAKQALTNGTVYFLYRERYLKALEWIDRLNLSVEERLPMEMRALSGLYRQRRYEEILPRLDALLIRPPPPLRALLLRGLVHIQMNNLVEAADDLRRYTSIRNEDVEPYRILGDVYYNLGQFRNASSNYSNYLNLGGQALEASERLAIVLYYAGEFGPAVEAYNDLIQKHEPQPWYFRRRGDTYYQLSLYPRTIADYTEALRQDPSLEEETLLLRLADAHLKLEAHAEARRVAARGVERYSDRADFHVLIARTYVATEQPAEAAAAYESAVDIEPSAEWYHRLGVLYAEINEVDRAIASLGESIQLKSNNAGAYVLRGILYKRQNDLDSALTDWTLACKLGEARACELLEEEG